MSHDILKSKLLRLENVLRDCRPAAIAVSGGVDSITLAFVAGRVLGERVSMFHAISPAVPPSATDRVKRHAAAYGWQLHVVSAGEFEDEKYVANPANRCFYCKSNLYATIRKLTDHQVLSGTNLDDLKDWRPGLQAAENHAVRHPYVETEIDKASVREIARAYGLTDVAELPAAPCLSSRVETGIPIDAGELRFVDETEIMLRDSVASATVRCRLRKSGITIELDAATCHAMDPERLASLSASVQEIAARHGIASEITFAPYHRGSAFLNDRK